MPLTSPGNDDDTGENHQPTLRKNTAEPVEQTLKQNSQIDKLRDEVERLRKILLERDTGIPTDPDTVLPKNQNR